LASVGVEATTGAAAVLALDADVGAAEEAEATAPLAATAPDAAAALGAAAEPLAPLASRLRLSIFELDTGLVATTGAATAMGVAPSGGTTRNTCPTSMRLGFSRLFQATTSRQFCPLSRAILITVSPDLTV